MTEEAIKEVSVQDEKGIDPSLLEAMAKAGVWYGRKKSKTNPRMRGFIYTTRNGVEIFDLPQTWEKIEAAGAFLRGIIAHGGSLLVVGTTPAGQGIAKKVGEMFGFPYVTERWLGGTLTNFKTLSLRIQHFKKLKADREAGRLEKYTKKERSDFNKEIEHLQVLFGGLERLESLPQVILAIGANAHLTAIREALRSKIPVIAIANSDTNPELVTHIIPANDTAKASVTWIVEQFIPFIEAGRKEAMMKKEEAAVKK